MTIPHYWTATTLPTAGRADEAGEPGAKGSERRRNTWSREVDKGDCVDVIVKCKRRRVGTAVVVMVWSRGEMMRDGVVRVRAEEETGRVSEIIALALTD
jgi:hypothetical protein